MGTAHLNSRDLLLPLLLPRARHRQRACIAEELRLDGCGCQAFLDSSSCRALLTGVLMWMQVTQIEASPVPCWEE